MIGKHYFRQAILPCDSFCLAERYGGRGGGGGGGGRGGGKITFLELPFHDRTSSGKLYCLMTVCLSRHYGRGWASWSQAKKPDMVKKIR